MASSGNNQSTLDYELIERLAKDMIVDIKNGEGYSSKYDYIKENTPKIYDMLVEDGEKSLKPLMFMLSKMKEIKKGSETQNSSSEKVGEYLAQKYIYPVIDTTKENIVKVEYD
jgi:hypothetical protein